MVTNIISIKLESISNNSIKKNRTYSYFFIVLLIAIVFLFISCDSFKKQSKNSSESKSAQFLLQKFMIGDWETSYIKITYPTYKKSDSNYVFEDDFSKPNSGKAQSTYKEDGTFSAWFLLANDKKVGETSGVWKTKGDSLYVNYQYQGKQVKTFYTITPTENGFKGKVIYDWDNDSEFDDKLLMKTKRLTNN
ncbi:hypothetical protein SAMN04489761_3158 [Tenacibaculum sp. MAR_2009_124]|uniref:hypothetical protein n=1 Tax=Tenacibaculum sp. MAR_2009_124 TaxID=1250059 RepID=UPI00089B0793|nr:hypothetical protein [Tenacibaculum sp. MAR_2009_124]SEC49823.1 hypothetical protein SAMN04489761_3158 [Tenacibaculum sp. MAR_2009_124]